MGLIHGSLLTFTLNKMFEYSEKHGETIIKHMLQHGKKHWNSHIFGLHSGSTSTPQNNILVKQKNNAWFHPSSILGINRHDSLNPNWLNMAGLCNPKFSPCWHVKPPFWLPILSQIPILTAGNVTIFWCCVNPWGPRSQRRFDRQVIQHREGGQLLAFGGSIEALEEGIHLGAMDLLEVNPLYMDIQMYTL